MTKFFQKALPTQCRDAIAVQTSCWSRSNDFYMACNSGYLLKIAKTSLISFMAHVAIV
jgi:hypothetical protein